MKELLSSEIWRMLWLKRVFPLSAAQPHSVKPCRHNRRVVRASPCSRTSEGAAADVAPSRCRFSRPRNPLLAGRGRPRCCSLHKVSGLDGERWSVTCGVIYCLIVVPIRASGIAGNAATVILVFTFEFLSACSGIVSLLIKVSPPSELPSLA